MTTDRTQQRALSVARKLAEEMAAGGARAVYLTGSWARGDAHSESDLDIRVIGPESPKELFRSDGFLVSCEWQDEQQHRKALDDVEEVGSVVPGWRSAVLLHDPDGIAASIKTEAERWSWERVEDDIDPFVAGQMTKYAEEVHSLIGNIDQGLRTGAAIERSMIVAGLAPALSVHLRILYETEKELWDLVGEQMGDGWSDLQAQALGEHDEDFVTSCTAALKLFRSAAQHTIDCADKRQREVIDHACEIAAEAVSKLESKD
ncbi:MAG: nucleotidyltransferase family protein [Actinomycetota bacterium]